MNLAQNTFDGGLMMDFHPLSVPNTMTTNCLNGTYLTYNGNEYMLLNDMGNGKVETAALPAGYIPLGTTSFGGIIYIVSYNPLKDVCQIGCFPSPERNFSYEELTEDGFLIHSISDNDFRKSSIEGSIDYDKIVNFKTKIELTKLTLNPGDKFLISSDNLTILKNADRITDYNSSTKKVGDNPRYLRLRVATKDTSGRLVYLDSSLKWYKFNESKFYFIPEDNIIKDNLATSKYSIFNSKLSGNLFLIAELETISSFSQTYTINYEDDKYYLDLNLEWSSDNWNDSQKGIDPKLINFTSNLEDGFYLIKDGKNNTELNINVYEDECDTLGGIYENRYPDINIDLENKVNSKTVRCGEIDKSYLTTREDKNRNFKITPGMEFGLLPTFEIVSSINFGQIGTGNTIINEWRYFKQDNSMILTYGFQDYPKPFHKTFGVDLEFIPLESLMDAENADKATALFTIKNIGKVSYSGSFTTEIDFDSLFGENRLYLIRIRKYSGINSFDEKGEVVGYRLLYTTDFFNDYYISDTEDFNDLYIPEDIISSGITCTYSKREDVQTNTLYKSETPDSHPEEYNINKCIVNSNKTEPAYRSGKCEKITTLSGLNVKSNAVSTYDIFTNFNAVVNPEYPKFVLQENDNCTLEKDKLTLKNEVVNQWTGYTTGTLNYQGALVPLLHDFNDLYPYNLVYDDVNKHFTFGGFSIFGDDGHIDEGLIEYDEENKKNYMIISEEETEGQKYRQSGNQCYPGSSLQLQLNPYTRNRGNIIAVSFAETLNNKGSSSMTYVYTKNPTNFYYKGVRVHITKAEGNGGKTKYYYPAGGSKLGCLIYSDLLGIFQKGEYGDYGDDLELGSSLNYDSNKNITSEPRNIATCGLMFRAINQSGDEVHVFTNNFALVGNSQQVPQSMFTLNPISFGDVLAMFLIQSYKYTTEDTEREVIYPDEILESDIKPTVAAINIETQILVNSFDIQNYKRNEIINKLKNTLDTNNLHFNSEVDNKYLTLYDQITYQTVVDNVIKDELSIDENSVVKAILLKDCKGNIKEINRKGVLNPTHVYGIDNDEYIDLSIRQLPDYNFYKVLKNITFEGDRFIAGDVMTESSSNLLPAHLEVLKLDEDGFLVLDLDKYKKIAKITWNVNNCRNYSTTNIQGISDEFTIANLLNVMK